MTHITHHIYWHRRNGRCIPISVLTLAIIYVSFFYGHLATADAFAAQAGRAASAHRRTLADSPTPGSKAAARKSPPAQGQGLQSRLRVKSKIAMVVDANTSEELLVKDVDRV